MSAEVNTAAMAALKQLPAGARLVLLVAPRPDTDEPLGFATNMDLAEADRLMRDLLTLHDRLRPA